MVFHGICGASMCFIWIGCCNSVAPCPGLSHWTLLWRSISKLLGWSQGPLLPFWNLESQEVKWIEESSNWGAILDSHKDCEATGQWPSDHGCNSAAFCHSAILYIVTLYYKYSKNNQRIILSQATSRNASLHQNYKQHMLKMTDHDWKCQFSGVFAKFLIFSSWKDSEWLWSMILQFTKVKPSASAFCRKHGPFPQLSSG